ncbi:MAG: N-acetylmuramoyl-L-alanine amidase [Actinomycetota bacterium]
MKTIGPGARGEDVRDVQARLGALGYRIDPDEHGEFGETTVLAVRTFQNQRQLLVDGLVGEDTWQELVEASHSLGDRILYLRLPHYRGDDVRDLQRWLNLLGFDAGREDGIFGERTDRAVRDFQKNVGLAGDGIVGAVTLSALTRVRPVGPGPGRATVREAEALRRLSATLEGARIAIDAGHGGEDEGGAGPAGLTEAEATALLARTVLDQLVTRRAEPFLLSPPDSRGPISDRASAANDRGAEVLISLHLHADPDPAVAGAACYYYGRGGYVSQAGQRLAELIMEELVDSVRMPTRGVHPKALPLLRETRMPAVHIEPGTITNPEEEAKLRSEAFRHDVAVAIASGVQRFFDGDVSRPAPAPPDAAEHEPEHRPEHDRSGRA